MVVVENCRHMVVVEICMWVWVKVSRMVVEESCKHMEVVGTCMLV